MENAIYTIKTRNASVKWNTNRGSASFNTIKKTFENSSKSQQTQTEVTHDQVYRLHGKARGAKMGTRLFL